MKNALQSYISVLPKLSCAFSRITPYGERDMLIRVLFTFFILSGTLLPNPGRADPVEPPSIEAASTVMYLANPGEQFRMLWGETISAIDNGDLGRAHEYLEELYELRVLHSVQSLDEYS